MRSALCAVAKASGFDQLGEPAFNCSVVTGFAFPDNKDAPTQLLQCQFLASVAGNIQCKLHGPKDNSGLWSRRLSAALVPMPEATVHENSQSMSREHEIGTTRQILAV